MTPEQLLEKALDRIAELERENSDLKQVISGQAARIERMRRQIEEFVI
jgi:phage shock protein A